MTKSIESLETFLAEQGWRYSKDPERRIIKFSINGENGVMHVITLINDRNDLFQLYIPHTVKVAPEKRGLLAETVARVNYGMIIGSFELDMNDGEIRFHVAHPFIDDNLPVDIIRHLVFVALNTFDDYLPAFMEVMYGNVPPEEAIKKVEAKYAPPPD